MSHIDNALKKAQEEKDSRYGSYSRISPATTNRSRNGRKGFRTITAAFILTALALIVLLMSWDRASDVHEKTIPHKNLTEKKALLSKQKDTIVTRAETLPPPEKNLKEPASAPVAVNESNATRGTDTIANIDTLYRKALGYQQENNLDKATEAYKNVLEIDPEHAFSLNNLGVIYLGRGHNKTAELMFKRAIDRENNYANPYYNLACLCSQEGNIPGALDYLKKAAQINNDVKNWVKDDRDLKNVRESEDFRNLFK